MFFIEWPKIALGWNLKNCGYSICISLTTSWTCLDDYVATTTTCVGFAMDNTGVIDTTSSTWMLSITWSKLGSSSSSMLPCVVVA